METFSIPNIPISMRLAPAKSLTSRMIKFRSNLMLKILILLLRSLRRMFSISFSLFDLEKKEG
jgi:hypothetical protein